MDYTDKIPLEVQGHLDDIISFYKLSSSGPTIFFL